MRRADMINVSAERPEGEGGGKGRHELPGFSRAPPSHADVRTRPNNLSLRVYPSIRVWRNTSGAAG